MKLTISPNLENPYTFEELLSGETETIVLNYVETPEGLISLTSFDVPEISYTVRMIKGDVGLKIAK